MKLSVTACLLLAGLLFAAGYAAHWFVSRDPGAVARVEALQRRADSLDQVAARRDTVHVTRLQTVRARTDTVLQQDTVIRTEVVTELVAGEREACDEALAAKDSTIAETRALRDDGIEEAEQLTQRGPSRLAFAGVVVFSKHEAPRFTATGTYRITRLLGFDINAGVGWSP